MPGYGAVASVVLLAPAVIGELGLTVWLLVKGVRLRRKPALASAPPGSVDAPLVAGAMGGTP